MVTAIYASILALWIIKLTLDVVKQRRKHKVSYGNGNVDELMIVKAAHENAIEAIPFFLILLFCFEYNSQLTWLVHLIGIVFIIGRVLHSKGMLSKNNFKPRVLGMQITLGIMITLAILNILFLPFDKVFAF